MIRSSALFPYSYNSNYHHPEQGCVGCARPVRSPEHAHSDFVWVDTPLPEKVRRPVIAGPVRVEAATAVTPSAVTGSDELLLN